ncbi:mitogen-activated protein kinase kinase kinase 20-like [Salvia miltiorrhiza]|uniref:mitogen-activated protein kinase kinase kinase 20-like n=1 Tax=Salvia miltiorrhiza TaxID=226208 RepID=UPI0025AD0356|nr:mitogen-activated protein kinase kinase kinase 20-like [Salvia miltiorrhiza]
MVVKGEEIGNEYGDGVAWIRGPVIGKGSFGCVYLASLRNPRSKYSCFPSVMAVKSAEVSASGSIQKEREVLSNVKGCNDIIRCFGEETTVGEGGAMVFNLLLEYGSGGTLAQRIRNSGGKGLPEFETKVFVKCLLRGLNHIHSIGYVHCDLKPENILLVPDARGRGLRAKIGDFGLAKRAEQSKKRKMEPYWRGTPMYLPPEAVTENLQEAPSDVWALGCIVLEMLTGKPPWSEDAELTGDDLIRKIGEGRESPRIPNGISKEAKDFLKGCFVRKSMYRLTADMLLLHPFLEDLGDDDAYVPQYGQVEDLDELESILLVCGSESESESEDDWDDASFSYWSEDDQDYAEDEEEEEVTSQEIEMNLKEEEIINGEGTRPMKKPRQVSSESSRQRYPVSFTIPAGV